MNPQPKTKLDEVCSLVDHAGLKELKSFCSHSKKRLEVRRSLESLIYKNSDSTLYSEACMGLGIIANYENKHQQALDYFKVAYSINPSGRAEVSNYAKALATAGLIEQAIDKFYEAFQLGYPSDMDNFNQLTRACLDFAYPEKLTKMLELDLRKMDPDSLNLLQIRASLCNNLVQFLNKNSIPTEIYRALRVKLETQIYSKITLSTFMKSVCFHDIDRNTYSFVFRIGSVKPTDIAEINDEIENATLDWLYDHAAQSSHVEARRMLGHLTFYCMPLDEVGNQNAS